MPSELSRASSGRSPFAGRLLAATIGLVAAAFFAQAVGNDFFWDDTIVLDRQLPYFTGLRDAFFPPQHLRQFSEHYYRPLVFVSYLLDRGVAKALSGPLGRERALAAAFHSSPVVLHGIATALVVLVTIGLLRRKGGPNVGAADLATGAAAGLLFALHPIHVEAVAWMAGRSDTLCAVFGLAAIAAFLSHARTLRWRWYALAVGFAACSMLAKETGVAIAALVPCLALVGPERPGRRVVASWLAGAGAAAGFVVLLRVLAMASRGGAPRAVIPTPAELLRAIGWYAVKLLWPPPQTIYIDRLPGSPLYAVAGAASCAALAAYAFIVLRGRSPGAAPTLVAMLFLVLAVAPSLSVVFVKVAAAPLAERYLYLPSAGAAMALALELKRLSPRRVLVPLLASLVLVVPYGMIAWSRQRVFADASLLWTDASLGAPASSFVWTQLGLTMKLKGRTAEAEPALRRALALARTPGESAYAGGALGVWLAENERYDEAAVRLRAALADAPDSEDPGSIRFDLANTLLHAAKSARNEQERDQEVAEATALLEESLAEDCRNSTALLYLGMLRMQAGREGEGRRLLLEVERLAPESDDAATARHRLRGLEGPQGRAE